jgi:peptidyl-prolyl cis-trans isomerase A (cyclophilin A)
VADKKTEAESGDLYATIQTNYGDVLIRLFADHAPTTVGNFVGLAQGKIEWTDPTGDKTSMPFYDGLTFHRVIPGFMIQGGCPRGDGRGGPGYTFKDEFHPDLSFNRPYLLAMANAGPNTNGSQFFVTVAPTPHLNHHHTIFGEVADQPSRDVVDRIARLATDRNDRPTTQVVISGVAIDRR